MPTGDLVKRKYSLIQQSVTTWLSGNMATGPNREPYKRSGKLGFTETQLFPYSRSPAGFTGKDLLGCLETGISALTILQNNVTLWYKES